MARKASKKLRIYGPLVREMNELDSNPEFRISLRANVPENYRVHIENLKRITSYKISLIPFDEKEPDQEKKLFLNLCQVSEVRAALIEAVLIYDSKILELIDIHERLNKIEFTKRSHYKNAEDGLNKVLNNKSTSRNFEQLRSKMSNYRILRHQFAHFRYGGFALDAKYENFESFIKKAKGIEALDSIHTQGPELKPAYVIPYTISSDDFLQDFFKESNEFIKELTELLIPLIKEKEEGS